MSRRLLCGLFDRFGMLGLGVTWVRWVLRFGIVRLSLLGFSLRSFDDLLSFFGSLLLVGECLVVVVLRVLLDIMVLRSSFLILQKYFDRLSLRLLNFRSRFLALIA